MTDAYTRVLQNVLELGDPRVADGVVTHLISHLRRTGRMKLLPKIARQLRTIDARRLTLFGYLEVANEKESASALAAAQAANIVTKRVRVNPDLIQGWRARSGDRLVDHSAKSALLNIYQKVTH